MFLSGVPHVERARVAVRKRTLSWRKTGAAVRRERDSISDDVLGETPKTDKESTFFLNCLKAFGYAIIFQFRQAALK